MLREQGYYGKAWIIMLNTKRAALLSTVPYTTEEIGDGGVVRQSDVVSANVDKPFIPSDFSKYLNKPHQVD